MKRKYILKAGTRLRSISLKDDISHPTQALYFTTIGEALISLFRKRENKSDLGLLQLLETGEDFYLNTFELTEDLILNDENAENLANLVESNFKLEDLRKTISEHCKTNEGLAFPYKCSILRKGKGYITGRITAYVICKPDILIHVGSFYINLDILYPFISETIRIWYLNEGIKDITISAILNDINESLLDVNWINYMFSRIFIQPNVPGYLTSKQFNVENLSQIPLPESPPKSPRISKFFPESLAVPIMGFDPFSKLSNDLIIIIASNMRLTDISKFCLSSKRFNQIICNNENFWAQKLKLDFKNAKPKPDNLTWKEYYKGLVALIQIELNANHLDNDFMEGIRNLPPEEQIAAIHERRRRLNLEEENYVLHLYYPLFIILNEAVDDQEYNETTRRFFFNLQDYADDYNLELEDAFNETFALFRRLNEGDERLEEVQDIFFTELQNNDTYVLEIESDEFNNLYRQAEMNRDFRSQLFETILDIGLRSNRQPLWIFDNIPVPRNNELRDEFILFLETRDQI